MIQLICSDSMILMEALKMRFDMIFLDPPYFEWQDRPLPHGESKDRYAQSGVKPDHNRLSYLAYRLLKPNGTVWLCGTQPQLVRDWKYWDRFFELLFELIAYKNAGTPPINMKQPIRTHENIWCLYSKRDSLKDLKVDIRKLAKEGRKVKAVKEAKRMPTRYDEWMEWSTEKHYPKSVVHVKRIDAKSKEYEGHPAQKPLDLMRLILKMATDEDDWILDPFAGVATTLVAAQELNRNCLGIEINPEYCRLAMRRLRRIKELEKIEKWLI